MFSSQFCSLDPSSKPTFPLLLHPLLEVLWILSLAVRPSKYKPVLFFLPIASILAWTWTCSRLETGRFGINFGLASRMMIILLSSSVDILLTNPQKYFASQKDITQKKFDGPEEKAPVVPSHFTSSNSYTNAHQATVNATQPQSSSIGSAPFLARFKWAVSYWFNPRSIGLPHEPTRVLPPKPSPSTTRTAFILQQLYTISIFYLLVDISLIMAHAYSARRSWMATHHGGMGHFDIWKLVNMGFGIQIYAMLVIEHCLIALTAVGLGLSEPQFWPPLYHNVTEAYTLKRFWGTFWQQLYRRVFIVHSDFFAHNILLLPRSRNKIIVFTKVTLVFLVSGILHFGGDALALQSLRKPGSFQFFCLQPVGLIIEDLILSVWCYFKPSAKVSSRTPPIFLKLVGFVWVFIWIGYTLPFWAEPLLDASYIEDVSKGVPSILLGLWKGQWVWPEDNQWEWTEKGP
ncbi:membrane bound O-acyl transferase family-domain-containing protein [Crepidotus variabilis]|uniref:Membrane bound O-acyl transferase family-domain-containing protein n=1 Tax=Crepidotus variabilis TaxID=179855 RepID=A0A9P6JWT9_9AGAR|nr:membrane bound O-acyl transferase family-domain-containing protein [Crepidotus variabilis]